ncbi:hypothetical protein FRB94_011046 [Tulasnella sp. JGI-2019a]|nr:hypothetical protein FRB93_002170 [Tulasnella sp. JGI-2019a]KAG8993133.1 hypothetical protein FRB94_011046 [Tulasnella sp. JGI-2019a]
MVFFESTEQEIEPGRTWRQHRERLRGICPLWKGLVDGYPGLWGRIDVELGRTNFSKKVNAIKTEVQKAKRSPLALYIHGGCYMYGPLKVTSKVLQVYHLIKDHRWRALPIFNPGYISPFE